MPSTNEIENNRHSDEIQDVISAIPPWIIRQGITVFIVFFLVIFIMAAVIHYPEIIKTTLQIETTDSPKPVVAKISGKLVKLLIINKSTVVNGQALAYIESTGNHSEILHLLNQLKTLRPQIGQSKESALILPKTDHLNALGELQGAYQTLYQAYLSFKASNKFGFSIEKKAFLQKDLRNLELQNQQLIVQKDIQSKDYDLAQQEFSMHEKLIQENVETRAEFRDAQSKLLSKKSPLVQTETAIINAKGAYTNKQKEILELDNQITEDRAKFLQALDSFISQADDWKSKYVLNASQTGEIVFAGLIQENQYLNANQEVFYVNPRNEQFFGQMKIPQDDMGKIKEGQKVLIKLRSYRYEQFGILNGTVSEIAEVPLKDSIFLSRVNLDTTKSSVKSTFHLKQGMTASAEIITQDATVIQRVGWNLLRIIDRK